MYQILVYVVRQSPNVWNFLWKLKISMIISLVSAAILGADQALGHCSYLCYMGINVDVMWISKILLFPVVLQSGYTVELVSETSPYSIWSIFLWCPWRLDSTFLQFVIDWKYSFVFDNFMQCRLLKTFNCICYINMNFRTSLAY